MASAGNTPTGVGKTWLRFDHCVLSKKHPHGRGEDAMASASGGYSAETPPRAWGRLKASYNQHKLARNTPTGVGKTAVFVAGGHGIWKHPHGRGEDARLP